MKCTCGRKAQVVSSHPKGDFTSRRLVCACGERFSTLEVSLKTLSVAHKNAMIRFMAMSDKEMYTLGILMKTIKLIQC